MDKVTNRKIDLSTKAGRDLNILSESGVKPNIKKDTMRYSEMMEEGLVEGKIQKGAITKRYIPSCWICYPAVSNIRLFKSTIKKYKLEFCLKQSE